MCVNWKGAGYAPKNAAATAMGRANPSKNTKPEVALRQELHRLGFRFRIHHAIVDGNPRPPKVDIAFTRLKLAIEVHGIFWHGRKKDYRPKHNTEYWERKFADNIARDKRNAKRLKRAGWLLLVVWDNWSLERQIKAVRRAYAKAAERLGEMAPSVPGDGGAGVGVVEAPGVEGRGGGSRRPRADNSNRVQRVAA